MDLWKRMNSLNIESGPPWSELPPLAIENIYSFLDRNDQKNMSLVCSNWNRFYSSPSLWRNVVMCFPDLKNKTSVTPEVTFARRFGALFHHVDVAFLAHRKEEPGYFRLTPATVMGQFKLFLQAVTRQSQLLSIAFLDMVFYLADLDDADRVDVCRAISDLLKSQKRLQKVEFRYCFFEASEAAEILKAVILNNSETLRCMHLLHFVENEIPDEFEDNTLGDGVNFLTLKNLEILEMNYTKIFENLLLSSYECRDKVGMNDRESHLKKIILICKDQRKLNPLRIDPEIWKYFKKISPGLRVYLTIESKCEPKMLLTFIVPYMPVSSLKFSLDFDAEPDKEIGILLRHITSCKINRSLESLFVFWQNSSPNVAPDLIKFTNLCPHLKVLDLDLEHPVAGLDTVLKSWLEQKPVSLEFVKISILNVERERDRRVYRNTLDFYSPLLQPLKICLLIL